VFPKVWPTIMGKWEKPTQFITILRKFLEKFMKKTVKILNNSHNSHITKNYNSTQKFTTAEKSNPIIATSPTPRFDVK
jgi:hypothetical protein